MRDTRFDARSSEWIGDMTVWLRDHAEDNSEQLERLRRGLRRAREQELTPRQREMVFLYYDRGLKMSQIAQKLGVNRSTVSRTVKRAKQRLYRILRLVLAVLGELIAAAALNLFIVPLSLYTGGLLGFCQLVRTLLQDFLGVSFGAYDIAGVLYFLLNIPLLMIGYRNLGRGLAVRTIICTVSYSVFYSIIPIPTQPIVDDYLTACLLGGILTGIGSGIVLTCGGSGGGLDVLGLIMSKRDSAFTVGKFALGFNALLYTAILILFDPEVAIYSVIYNFANSMILDRMHQQNVTVQALIFTREDESVLADFIIKQLGRSVTYWDGVGAYTKDDVRVLCVCLSKYEIEELLHMVHSVDPHAFLTVQEGVRVFGNFPRKLG